MSEDIQRVLGRVEAKIDNIVLALKDMKTDHAELEIRVSYLEHAYWRLVGFGSAAIIFWGAVSDKVLHIFGLK